MTTFSPDRAGRQQTVREFFSKRYIPECLVDTKCRTIKDYHHALNRLHAFLHQEAVLDDLANGAIAGCMGWMLEQGRARPTVNKLRAHLLAICHFATECGLLEALPKVRRLREFKRIPRAWSIAEVGLLLDAARETPGYVCGVKASRFWSALILFAYDTGLRISAILELRPEHVDLTQKSVSVPPEIQKQAMEQLLYLSDQTVEALAAIRSDEPYLFPWPHDRGGPGWPVLNRHYRRILARAGLPSTRKDLFHKIRRTTASYIHAAGGNACTQLGHSTDRVTRMYLDPRICSQSRLVALLPRPGVNDSGNHAPLEPPKH